MFSGQKQVFLFLIVIIAVFALFATLTDSFEAILRANAFFLAVACLFFVFSVLLWIFSWAFLLKKHANLPFGKVLVLGFASVFASLTPLQLGTDALRALLLKEHCNASFSDSIAASMAAKGLKFLVIAAFAACIVLFFFFLESGIIFRTALLSGFAVILLAAALFLLPLNKKIGLKIARFFRRLAGFWKKFFLLEIFFLNYSDYLARVKKKTMLIVFLLVSASFFFEFLSLMFSFEAVNAAIPFGSLIILFALVSILEHAPFSPRGIGLVEAIGFFFVSADAPGIPAEKIASALIIFGIARIVVPAVLSLALYSFLQQKNLLKKTAVHPAKN